MIGKGLVLAMAVAAALPAQDNSGSGDTDRDPVFAACVKAGGEAAGCACVSREARSRFTPLQMQVIAHAMPDLRNVGQPQAEIDALGFNFDQILNLRQRALNADDVIRNACGIGLGFPGQH